MSGIRGNNGWLEAAIAWEVCASLHRQYCKGKDALFTTRQSDFVKHAEDAREYASRGQAPAQQGVQWQCGPQASGFTAPQADSVPAPAATCPTCKAPCTTTVNMRGGEYGWGTTDLERTVYHYAPAQAADSVLEDAARWQALPAFFEEYQIDAMKLYRDIDAYLDAARKQGANHE